MQDFRKVAQNLISSIVDKIELNDKEAILEIDQKDEVTQISTPSGIYVINANHYLHEIWVSSPLSGPHHFKLKESLTKKHDWMNKHGKEIMLLLNEEFKQIANIDFF